MASTVARTAWKGGAIQLTGQPTDHHATSPPAHQLTYPPGDQVTFSLQATRRLLAAGPLAQGHQATFGLARDAGARGLSVPSSWSRTPWSAVLISADSARMSHNDLGEARASVGVRLRLRPRPRPRLDLQLSTISSGCNPVYQALQPYMCQGRTGLQPSTMAACSMLPTAMASSFGVLHSTTNRFCLGVSSSACAVTPLGSGVRRTWRGDIQVTCAAARRHVYPLLSAGRCLHTPEAARCGRGTGIARAWRGRGAAGFLWPAWRTMVASTVSLGCRLAGVPAMKREWPASNASDTAAPRPSPVG